MEGGLFPIDCLIAPEAACPGPLAKSVIFVAKVGLGRFPSLSPRFEEDNPESPERLEEPGVCWLCFSRVSYSARAAGIKFLQP